MKLKSIKSSYKFHYEINKIHLEWLFIRKTLFFLSDLVHQIELIKKTCPNYEIIQDIARGFKFNRPGLNKILKLAINKEFDKVVVMYKDRLARFGFELIEFIINETSK